MEEERLLLCERFVFLDDRLCLLLRAWRERELDRDEDEEDEEDDE